jgi:formylglycine-generating enzyme required for sulfatase activity
MTQKKGRKRANPLSAPRPDIAVPHILKVASPLEMEWCWVPAGPFTMGSSDESGDESPIHEVHLDDFWMARYPVTNTQYRLFVEANGYQESRWWSDAGRQWLDGEKVAEPRFWTYSEWSGAAQPVIGVSWYEAAAFCRWAADLTGNTIRLPSEAEWEKAARSTDKRKYPWGNNIPTKNLANFGEDPGKTTPVGQYSPNGDSPYGCADMAGNVWEWVNDWYADDYYQKSVGRNPKGPDLGDSKVVRGGAWLNLAFDVRTSYRSRLDPSNREVIIGFRCASTPF